MIQYANLESHDQPLFAEELYPQSKAPHRIAWFVFVFGAIVIGMTAAGPGLTWDEPAYRGSQTQVQEWLHELTHSAGLSMLGYEEIKHYWEFNRFGPNFHPPMASYLNLLTFAGFGHWLDDIFARRLASAFQLAGLAAILCGFLGTRYGWATGLLAGLSLLFMPRLVGDAHVIGTDITMLFFWTTTAITFYLGLHSPRWQWWCAISAACLFLTKFSGVVLVVPLAIWFLGVLLTYRHFVLRWLFISALMIVPLVPMAVATLTSLFPPGRSGLIAEYSRWVHAYPWLLTSTLIIPGLILAWHRRNKPADWPEALELPWKILALTPLLAIALNPTWWHYPPEGLATYFDLNFNRQGRLPDIGIFYLGERYSYSLPWHNGIVLLSITVPFGTLFLGLVGAGYALSRITKDRLPMYLLLQMITLIVFRMFPTPAHDGVRLFLPTFLFFAALAGLGAQAIAANHRGRWLLLFLIGPVWSSVDWWRTHPYELSYYNVGLKRAFDAGFEATYWYDAVTPRVLADLNEGPNRLPDNIPVIVGLDPLINTETFHFLQSLGKLRADINQDVSPDTPNKWAWLLTHSSKCTPFTRLNYSMKPHYASSFDGVRLFSVIEPKSLNTALVLTAMTCEKGQMSSTAGGTTRREPMRLFNHAFIATEDDYRQALAAYRSGNMEQLPNDVKHLLSHWQSNPFAAMYLPKIEAEDPSAVDAAVSILSRRSKDVHTVLENAGYLSPERFGGWFEANGGQIKNQ